MYKNTGKDVDMKYSPLATSAQAVLEDRGFANSDAVRDIVEELTGKRPGADTIAEVKK